ncbi:MAG: hypothetical protein COB81_01480 [Flavobacteriaceae bacterium]|nr:MAG: hypothetical protein COB81_01480 [Flavobacteriaceae bacterium]
MSNYTYITLLIILVTNTTFGQDFNGFNTVLRTNRLTSAPYYIEIDYPSTLPGLVARYRADDLESIIDDSKPWVNGSGKSPGKKATHHKFNRTVFQWRDISKRDTDGDGIPDKNNNNHLTAYNKYRSFTDANASASYSYNTISSPSYQTNANVSGDGINDHLFKDIEPNLTENFTFIFVMRATNPDPGTWNSFIASSSNTSEDDPNGPSIAGAWQISTNENTDKLFFGYCGKIKNGTNWLPLIDFDTKRHVYYIEYHKPSKKLTIFVDGLAKVSHTVSAENIGPIIDELRLFRNRNMDTYIAAEFNEFFLADRLFTTGEKMKVTNYLIYKWGVNL